jgi:glycosyltransferase involved in cell wall biosynthesis
MTATTVHLPDAGEANPYQRNLVDALEAADTPTTLVDPAQPILFAALRAARANDADLVHLHWLHTFYYGDNFAETAIKSIAFALEVILLRVLGYSLVWTAHNTIPHDAEWPAYHRLYRRLFVSFGAAAVIVHCPRARDILSESYGLNTRLTMKCQVVPHGNYVNDYANTTTREEARESLSLDDETVFLFFGNLRPYKGVENLLSAFESLDKPEAHLLIAGNPSSERYGRQLKTRIQNCEAVTLFADFIPDDELQTYFNAADAAVFPFRDVLTSGSVVSALSFGCPPIVPNIGCNEYLVGDDAGIVYDPTSSLEAVLTKACTRDLGTMRDNALDRATSLDWASIGEQTAEVYTKVLDY